MIFVRKLRFLQIAVVALLGLGGMSATAKTVLIDVRTPDEYSAGHLSGAINIDYLQISRRIEASGVKKDDEVILYCRSGRRSGIALESLKGLGFKRVANYGSMEEAAKKLQQASSRK